MIVESYLLKQNVTEEMKIDIDSILHVNPLDSTDKTPSNQRKKAAWGWRKGEEKIKEVET